MKTTFNCSQIRMVQLSQNDTAVTLEVSWVGRDYSWFARKSYFENSYQKGDILKEFNYAYERISNALSRGDTSVDTELTCL